MIYIVVDKAQVTPEEEIKNLHFLVQPLRRGQNRATAVGLWFTLTDSKESYCLSGRWPVQLLFGLKKKETDPSFSGSHDPGHRVSLQQKPFLDIL